MTAAEQTVLRQMLAPKPRYCDGCTQAIGWRSKTVEAVPWFAGMIAFVIVGASFPFLFGIDSSFLNAFTTNLTAIGYDNIAQYFRWMNLGWPTVGAIVGFLVSARIRNIYRDDRIGLLKRRVPIFGWYLPRLYYTRKVNRVASTGSEDRPTRPV